MLGGGRFKVAEVLDQQSLYVGPVLLDRMRKNGLKNLKLLETSTSDLLEVVPKKRGKLR